MPPLQIHLDPPIEQPKPEQHRLQKLSYSHRLTVSCHYFSSVPVPSKLSKVSPSLHSCTLPETKHIYIYIAPETWFHWFQVPNHPASLFKKGRKFPLFFRGGNSSAASRQGAKLHTNLELFALNLITDIAEIPYPWRWQACARGRKRDLLKRWMDRLDVSKTHPKVPWNAGKWRWYWNLNLGIFFHGWFRDVEVVFPFPKVEDGLVLCNLPCSNHTRSSLLHCLPRLLLLTHMQHSPQAKHPTEAPKKKSDKWGVKNSTKK